MWGVGGGAGERQICTHASHMWIAGSIGRCWCIPVAEKSCLPFSGEAHQYSKLKPRRALYGEHPLLKTLEGILSLPP